MVVWVIVPSKVGNVSRVPTVPSRMCAYKVVFHVCNDSTVMDEHGIGFIPTTIFVKYKTGFLQLALNLVICQGVILLFQIGAEPFNL